MRLRSLSPRSMMNTMHYQHIITQTLEGVISLVTLSRPESANALNKLMAEELAQAVKIATKDPFIRAVIVTGAGNRAFCAGADLKERKGMDKNQWHTQHIAFEHALSALLHCPKPVLACVNGAAIGGGLELALACDFIYASENASFGLTEATLGIMPGMGGTQNLPRAIGQRAAKEMLFTGKIMSATTAHDKGLVNAVFPSATLLQETMTTAKTIANNAPLAIAHIKRAIAEGSEQPLEGALQTELYYYNQLLETQDRIEGINAFNEKRRPVFTGN